jgi:hypothetical protein
VPSIVKADYYDDAVYNVAYGVAVEGFVQYWITDKMNRGSRMLANHFLSSRPGYIHTLANQLLARCC